MKLQNRKGLFPAYAGKLSKKKLQTFAGFQIIEDGFNRYACSLENGLTDKNFRVYLNYIAYGYHESKIEKTVKIFQDESTHVPTRRD